MSKFTILVIFYGLLWLGSTSLYGQKTIVDPNAQVRSVDKFTAIAISGPFEIVLTQSTEQVVVVSASDPSVRDNITTEVKGNTLYIGYKKSSIRMGRQLKAYVSVTELDRIELSGSTVLKMEGMLKVNRLLAKVSGSSDFLGGIQANELMLESSGSCDFKLLGLTNKLSILVSGSSDVKAFALQSNYCDITSSGNGNLEVTVNKELSITASGAGNIFYQGEGLLKKQNVSGIVTVKRKE